MKKLGLSDDQRAQVKAIRKKYKPQLKDLGDAVRKAHEGLGQVMAQHPAIDQARAEHKKVQDAMTAMDNARFEMMYEIAGVLTQDQRTKLLSLHKEMAEKWHKHHGPPPDKDD
jgi:Spy/CpxP family protein refolding chaperone